MDSVAFRLANALVGNDEGAAGLEITLSGSSHSLLSRRPKFKEWLELTRCSAEVVAGLETSLSSSSHSWLSIHWKPPDCCRQSAAGLLNTLSGQAYTKHAQ